MTAGPAPTPFGLDTLLSRSWALFQRNWIVAVPPVIAGVVSIAGFAALLALLAVTAIARGGLAHPSQSVGGVFIAACVGFSVIVLALMLWAYTAMFGMADAAWARGTATFGDGFTAFRARAGGTIVALIGMVGLGIAALILAIPTLGIAFLAFPVLTMYVFPSVIGGRRGGFEAIAESFRLVRRHLGQSVIAIVVLLAIWYGISFLTAFAIIPLQLTILPNGSESIPQAPPIGLALVCGLLYLVTTAASIAYAGFYAIALTGLYRELAAQAAAPPIAAAGTSVTPA
ncbi:MAG: hypothetical protein PVSMB8_14440 [Vulcanimicrobiaceae bacterium]